MSPLLDLVMSVVKSYPSIFASPAVDLVYVIVLGLVAAQYSRVQSLEERVFGRPLNKAFNQTVLSIGLGLLGGLAASVLLVLVGVTVSDSGVGYLLPVALVLFLFSPRFLCFSYAGGLISLSYLLLGWPKVNVAAIAALVACLHAAESLLIWVSGESCATPLYLPDPKSEGGTVGGFSLQRFWPIPLIVLFLVKVPDISRLSGLITLPDWWPLIKAPDVAGIGTPVFQMMPIVAALGYGDLALSRSPREKARSTSRHLSVFSGILLGFAIAASRWPAFNWIAALFGPIGHEVVIRVGNREEAERGARYVSSPDGVAVMGAFEGSPAATSGIGRGYVLVGCGGIPIRSRRDLEILLEEPGDVVLTVRPPGSSSAKEVVVRRNGAEPLGVILAPGLGDQPFATTRTEGPLLHLLRRLLGKA